MALAPALELHSVTDDAGISHIPHNIDAEQALLGSLLFDNAVFEKLSDQLQPRISTSRSTPVCSRRSKNISSAVSWPSRSC